MIYLKISQYVYQIGLNCGYNIFPLIADSGVDAPYVVYKRNEQLPNENKDGIGYYTASYSINFIASSYAQSVEMLTKYTEAIYTGDTDFGVVVTDVDIQDAGEDWVEGYFIQSINLTINYCIK